MGGWSLLVALCLENKMMKNMKYEIVQVFFGGNIGSMRKDPYILYSSGEFRVLTIPSNMNKVQLI